MYKPKMILGIATDAKTVKGEVLNVLTGILYLAPSDISGYQVCPMAKKASCEIGCLFSAGRGIMTPVRDARINKTVRFFEDRQNFMLDIIFSIQALRRKAAKLGMIPMVRLNGTSDVLWENIPFVFEGKDYNNLMELFPTTQFYDYTKLPTRKTPLNYDLTFSYSGVEGYQSIVKKAIKRGMRMAVVFRDVMKIPSNFMGMAVVSGDNSDVRPYDEQGVVTALYAKGKAKKDYSGFVVD